MGKNPKYVELSDRAIQDWIVKSGMWKNQGWGAESNDKPFYSFGLEQVDNHSILNAVLDMAPLYPRHYVLMEVKQNLTASDRKQNLKRFNFTQFKRVAAVV